MPDPAPLADEPLSAYDLLSKPTVELTDAEVELICTDLRNRRLAYINHKKRDEPHKKPAKPVTPEEKAANTIGLAAELGLDLDIGE